MRERDKGKYPTFYVRPPPLLLRREIDQLNLEREKWRRRRSYILRPRLLPPPWDDGKKEQGERKKNEDEEEEVVVVIWGPSDEAPRWDLTVGDG